MTQPAMPLEGSEAVHDGDIFGLAVVCADVVDTGSVSVDDLVADVAGALQGSPVIEEEEENQSWFDVVSRLMGDK